MLIPVSINIGRIAHLTVKCKPNCAVLFFSQKSCISRHKSRFIAGEHRRKASVVKFKLKHGFRLLGYTKLVLECNN